MQKTGPEVKDPGSGLTFRRLDVTAALDRMLENAPPNESEGKHSLAFSRRRLLLLRLVEEFGIAAIIERGS